MTIEYPAAQAACNTILKTESVLLSLDNKNNTATCKVNDMYYLVNLRTMRVIDSDFYPRWRHTYVSNTLSNIEKKDIQLRKRNGRKAY